ncbi:hypothetical protein [Candidatus Phytoplasma fabacearum]|nr:hypothetical protein ['Bituminaria bituminosa' little leaf phytoplasma]MDV3148609.1 hypothetical protein [Pigeon pea little leaf phytoplasma]MDO7983564.1 hypothetical protein ['Bituminaria bituminosa' little leaf phytoplasma]MDO8030533.1 hypothetical protein ['Bituminaria bituminosa' little leaf phytoplasma]MDV3154145.1 hypothetical protein [Pigeon pea little leaf phytoplasma]MDV3164267.1 hypothetical protein [Pigeon pea little leaf phytoplasma]
MSCLLTNYQHDKHCKAKNGFLKRKLSGITAVLKSGLRRSS